MHSKKVKLVGHIINSLSLSKTLDAILERGGDFRIDELKIGHSEKDISSANLEVIAPDDETLNRILSVISKEGAQETVERRVQLRQTDKDGAVPEDFYSTTNLETEIFLDNGWITAEDIEMDCIIVVNREQRTARCVPIADIRRGDWIVVGHEGIRVHPLRRDQKKHEVFSFMSSTVSSEKPKTLVIQDIARRMRSIREQSGTIAIVGGPTIVHTGAGQHLCDLIRRGYVQVLLAGNALATHDLEVAFFGTSLGIRLQDGAEEEGGHRNHLRAINRIRNIGSIREAVEQGILTSGIMYECVKNSVPFVLGGSIRDDGPLPEVITDVIETQRAMRSALRGVSLVIMMGSMLHSIAVGNILPASAATICVDINSAVITKLSDRGSSQVTGLVTDVESFLRELSSELS